MHPVLTALLALPVLAQTPAPVTLDAFDRDAPAWKYVGGWEFAGATGDARVEEGTYHISADFTGGGAYIGAWRDLASLEGLDFSAIRFRVRSRGATHLMVRISDASGQCHQSTAPAPKGDRWTEVALPVRDLVGGDHWGGANDGKWHGPATGLGIHLIKQGETKQDLWLDDIAVVPGTAVPGKATLHRARLEPAACRPGLGSRITFRWDAQPLGRDYTVFVHVLDATGKMVMQADHAPPGGTATWSGRVEYGRTLIVPSTMPAGRYRITAGLYHPSGAKRGWDRQELGLGPGVNDASVGEERRRCDIGELVVDPDAPVPALPEPTLDLRQFRLTWSDEFDTLSVSRQGPGTRWIAHTPYWGDFGDAGFADPEPGFPFVVEEGVLRIEARKTEKGWRSGLLASVDPDGKGFSQQYGYFEMRAKFPASLGMWPAFWLCGVRGIKERNIASPEIDVVEFYGVGPTALHMTIHTWGPEGKHWAEGDTAIVTGMTEAFHRYGVLVEEKETVWYFDGVEMWRRPTPDAARTSVYLLVNLAMGGGWPIDRAVSPSFMHVDYVRAYARK